MRSKGLIGVRSWRVKDLDLSPWKSWVGIIGFRTDCV